jgi:hypothetical protein
MMPPLPPIHFMLDIDGEGALQDPPLHRLKVALERGALFAGQFVQGVWLQRAQQLDIRHTGRYLRGIGKDARIELVQGAPEVSVDGDLQFEIIVDITNTAAHASFVEDGHPAFHLPSRIDWSRGDGRIKRTEDGRPYLHIPFRHYAYRRGATAEELASGEPPRHTREGSGYTYQAVRNMMPESISREASNLQRRLPTNAGVQRRPDGQFLAADRYRWEHPQQHHNRRLDRSGTSPMFIMGGRDIGYEEHRPARQVGKDPQGNPMVNPAWQSSKFHGLFRGGPKGQEQYMTIRTITPDSEGWHIPAQVGMGVARSVASIVEHGEAGRKLGALVAAQIQAALEGVA